jgi:hypothetical protein
MSRPELWIVGDWRQPEFAAVINWLETQTRCRFVGTFDEAAATPSNPPAAILVMESRPGQASRAVVERLHAAAPLARLAALLGPWCEGESRSGRPWPGVARIPWSAWQSRLPRELGLARSGPEVQPRLPRTATEAERLLHWLPRPGQPAASGTAEIRTHSRAEFEALRDALRTLGVKATWPGPDVAPPQPPADLIVCDGWEHAALPAPPDAYRAEGPPRLLLLGFPRPKDLQRAEELGFSAVLACPLLLADLAAALDRVLPQTAQPQGVAAA